jgi:hypothetical protein
MHFRRLTAGLLGVALWIGTPQAEAAETCQQVDGATGTSSQWQSGWLDLTTPTVLAKGDRLRITVGGTANKVVVRILRDGESPNDPVGVIGVFEVPTSRILDIVLDDDFAGVKQVSVHGGSRPWGTYDLGESNGPATVSRVERCRLSLGSGPQR